jgi:hypothetical protein
MYSSALHNSSNNNSDTDINECEHPSLGLGERSAAAHKCSV